jgi:hypothetical protein
MQEVPQPSRHQEPNIPESSGGEAKVPPPPPPAPRRVSGGWPEEMEEALTSASLPEEHRALMGAVLQSLRSVDNGLKEACSGLLTGFKVSHVITCLLEMMFLCNHVYSSPQALCEFERLMRG